MGLPRPTELAALGAVLCLYRAQPGGELGGWSQAVEARACSGVDSEGLRGRVLFFDREGRCCWRLCLLPDSDFLAWEQMVARLPAAAEPPQPGGIGERLWRGLAGRLQGERWKASILRLHALSAAQRQGRETPGGVLAASLAALSPLGASAARRKACEDGADAGNIAAVDDCCCEQAARAAAALAGGASGMATHRPAIHAVRDNLVRSNLGAQA